MYHSYIGKQLVKCVNKREGTSHTMRSFFDEVYFPLFFDDERYLQNVNNSPVDQAYKQRKKKPLTPDRRQECLEEIHTKAKDGSPDASFFVGGFAIPFNPRSREWSTTSGQVTDINLAISEDDIYASWFGAALGIGVAGGFCLLLDDDDTLLALYDGWSEYRSVLDQTDNLKPRQIETWNGQWLCHRFRHDYDPDVIMSRSDKVNKSTGSFELTTQSWIQVIFALARHYQKTPHHDLTAYVYNFGQTNSTFGFARLNLPEVRRPVDLFQQLFTVPEGSTIKDFESLYETEFTFITACQMGEIGLRSIQPKKTSTLHRKEEWLREHSEENKKE